MNRNLTIKQNILTWGNHIAYFFFRLRHRWKGKHHLVYWELAHLSDDCPYCDICGANRKDGYQFQWYNERHHALRKAMGDKFEENYRTGLHNAIRHWERSGGVRFIDSPE